MVSLPLADALELKRAGLDRGRMRMSRPSVSWSFEVGRSTLAMSWASWARLSSSQKTAGVPVARARVTASLTQSWIGASLVWQARQMSPASTSCS
jgi:hypothetical protein